MPFHIILWTPGDNLINQTQKSIYTLHLIHSSIYISLRYCISAYRFLDTFITNKLFGVKSGIKNKKASKRHILKATSKT